MEASAGAVQGVGDLPQYRHDPGFRLQHQLFAKGVGVLAIIIKRNSVSFRCMSGGLVRSGTRAKALCP
jgi:hypothetical protein